MLKDRLVRAAFATENGFLINAGFEQASQIVVYEVTTAGAKECAVMTYHAAETTSAAHKGKGKCGHGGGCGGSKREESPINEEEIAKKIADLDGISVLFVSKPLKTYSILALNETRIFTVKLDEQREIADVIVRLQDMLRGTPPLWMRRTLIGENAPVEEESAQEIRTGA